MGFTVNTNLMASMAYNNLNNTQNALSNSLEKLSSGLRINKAADDAAGLAISEGMKSQISGLGVAANNAQDGINVIQTAEGGLSQAQSILQRLRDLSVQAANDSNNTDSRNAIQTEAKSLTDELTRISGSTNFGGTNLLNGDKQSLSFQIGANGDSNSHISLDLSSQGMNVKNIAVALGNGSVSSGGTAFTIDYTKVTNAAATFTSTAADGTVTTVKTGTLAAGSGTAGAYVSVDEYANALRGDAAFSANFNVAVNHDANGGGSGITITAKDGGKLNAADNTAVKVGGGTAAAGYGATADDSATTATTGIQFDTAAHAQASIALLDQQITAISTARATLGATQNRLTSAIQTINISQQNLTAASSRITDTDMAKEMVNYTRSSILSQAGTAMLAQANQANQGVLKLLQ